MKTKDHGLFTDTLDFVGYWFFELKNIHLPPGVPAEWINWGFVWDDVAHKFTATKEGDHVRVIENLQEPDPIESDLGQPTSENILCPPNKPFVVTCMECDRYKCEPFGWLPIPDIKRADFRISHGLCPTCAELWKQKIDRMR